MKRLLPLLAMALCVLLVFCSCEKKNKDAETQPSTEPQSDPLTDPVTDELTDPPVTYPPMTLPEGYEGFDGPVDRPAFADGASVWSATKMGGQALIDDRYRIVIPDGNSTASSNAVTLRNNINSTLSLSIVYTTDKQETQQREICIGFVSGRAEITTVVP